MNNVLKYLYHRYNRHQSGWYPFVSVYYLTYRCDFRCSYCSDGSGKPYYQLGSHAVSGRQAISIIKEIRKYSNIFSLTGGEPLNHPDFGEVITEIGKLNFKNLILTTNGYDLEDHLPEIAKSVDTLIFSLDSLDSEKADKVYGKPSGTLDRILNNIEIAKSYPKKKYDILISSVATPDNIRDLYAVYDYVKSNDFQIAVCPQLKGVKAHTSLNGNEEYRELYDFLINEKSGNKKIFGSKKYLEYMRDLKKFYCVPFTMLVVSPTGEIYYPCLEIGNPVGNINGIKDLHEARRLGYEKYGPQPNCGTQCHSACALTFSLLLGNRPEIYT